MTIESAARWVLLIVGALWTVRQTLRAIYERDWPTVTLGCMLLMGASGVAIILWSMGQP